MTNDLTKLGSIGRARHRPHGGHRPRAGHGRGRHQPGLVRQRRGVHRHRKRQRPSDDELEDVDEQLGPRPERHGERGGVSPPEHPDASEATGNQAWTEQDFGQADTDQSGDLDDAEFARMIFVIYDADQSGELSEDEYSDYTEDQEAMNEGSQQ